MPYCTYYGPNTIVAEQCLWIADGNRRICVTYEYDTSTGNLLYAATVFRCDMNDTETGFFEPSEQQMLDNAHTTQRRFEIRPVAVNVADNLRYDDIIAAIRCEMCHGFGCKGPRGSEIPDNESMSSENTFLSDVEEDPDYDSEEDVDVESLEHKKIRKVRYISNTQVERYHGEKTTIMREYFIAFKANKRTGDLIYGAAISRRREEDGPIEDKNVIQDHYKTAIARLEKKPVPMRIDEDFRHQLGRSVTHREDVMYQILDVINSRPGGRFLIKGYW